MRDDQPVAKSFAAPGNPYDHSRPVAEPDLFAGRHELLKNLRYALQLACADRPQYKNIAITGERGIGKTSLLNKVAAMAEDEFMQVAVRIDLNNELAANQSALFHAILEQLVARLRELQPLGPVRRLLGRLGGRTSFELELNLLIGTLKAAQKDAERSQLPQERLAEGLRRLADQAAAAGIRALVVCLDEADLLVADQTVLQALRNVFQQQQGYLLVICGTERLLDELGKVFGPIQRFFEPARLGPFDGPAEVLECLRAPLDAAGQARVDERFARAVFDLTGGKPFLVKLLAFHAWRALEADGQSRLRLTQEVIDAWSDAAQHHGVGDAAQAALARGIELAALPPPPAAPPSAAAGAGADPAVERALQALQDDVPEFDLNAAAEDEPEDDADGAAVVRLVERVITDAVRGGATEVLLLAEEKAMTVKLRVDGQLRTTMSLPQRMVRTVPARLKIIANLDIAERRMPQDGRAVFRFDGHAYRANVSTLPSVHGESLRVALEPMDQALLTLDELGLSEPDRDRLRAVLARRDGLLLVCGPGGSGVSTTLRAFQALVARGDAYVVAIDEPSSRVVTGVTQVAANRRIGLTVSSLLQAVERHNPDLVFAHDVYDEESISTAFRVALGGRLVVAGLRVGDALGALARLTDVGIARYAVADMLAGVLAQRLLRTLCPRCRAGGDGVPWIKGDGCDHCAGTGYRGQIGVFQWLAIDDEMRRAIRDGRSQEELHAIAQRSGLLALRDAAQAHVRAGLTSAEEVARVIA